MPFSKGIFKKLRNLKKRVTFNGRRKKNNSELDIEELQQSLCVIDEENLSIKKQIKHKNLEIEKLTQENSILKEKYETKETLFEEDRRFLCSEINLLRSEINENNMEMEKVRKHNESSEKKCKSLGELLKDERKLNQAFKDDKCRLEQEILNLNCDAKHVRNLNVIRVKQENNGTFTDALVKEVESLRAVLELKQNEIKKLQLALVEAKQKEEGFEVVTRNVHLLKIKCEDLEEQLKRKSECKKTLEDEICKSRKTILEKDAEMKKLSYKNEELLWRLENNGSTGLETTKYYQVSPPQIRKYVKKRSSIGYILDLDERSKKVKKLQRINELRLDQKKGINLKVDIST